MMRAILYLSIVSLIGCGGQPGPSKAKNTEDPQLTAIKESIAKTTAQEKAMITRVQGMKPEVNEQISGKTLAELVEDFSKNKGAFNILPIGWEAAQKKNGRWKVLFHYQDYQKQYLTAEWELNPETNKLYPFDLKNSPQFWTGVGVEKDRQAAKGKK